MICSNCNAENRDGRRFCGQCGSPLTVTCAVCGSANEPDERFCGECGSSLIPAATGEAPLQPVSERRVVSILFADLVGFTSLSEQRDPEDVRELLARYFDVASAIVTKYGGALEKFIGDAVVAVWGSPIALEDDAERAVRAALELVAAVAELGNGTEGGLTLRAAVSTGETAVTIGARGQGMVAGDVVNTTARMQSAAEPGTVLIDESTRRSTEAAIACAPAGAFTFKGKSDPVELWTALRVVAARGGEGRSAGLEPPFVGRDRELRLMRESAHAVAEERRAHLVSIVGVGGIGKSRLAWEFEKYMDGLVEAFFWHQGRCLSYGDGVAFWALAEMVRMRARIKEDEPSDTASAKLDEVIETFITDPEERSWVTPAMRHLLGVEDLGGIDRGRLFSAWRLFFERMANEGPTVLVFEDIQWADQALLDFIDYLMEWSRNHPLMVVTLARPELGDRRPGWGSGTRAFTSLGLEPLPHDTMGELVAGMAPGLSEALVEQIATQAEGVPLYAVETVRMLLDREVLTRIDGQVVAVGEVETLEIPETLHALAAARLDALGENERRIIADASVLGKTFQIDGLSAISGIAPDALAPDLGSLTRKEILSVQSDPRSPEQGMYGFVQELLRTVAYETLSRRDRKARHLATARHLESLSSSDELSEVIAAHQLDAYRAAPDDDDSAELRARARETLLRAAQRASSLAAPSEALRLVLQATELSDADSERGELLLRAARLSLSAGEVAGAVDLAGQAIALLAIDDDHAAAPARVVRAEAQFLNSQVEEALEEMEAAYAVLSTQEPDAALAQLAGQLGRLRIFNASERDPIEPLDRAIEIAEALDLPATLSDALNSKGIQILGTRPQESRSLLEGALRLALEAEAPIATLRAYFNCAYYYEGWGLPYDEVDEAGLALARRLGERQWERSFQLHQAVSLFRRGRWDESLAMAWAVLEAGGQQGDIFVDALRANPVGLILAHRGQIAAAREALADLPDVEARADVQERSTWAAAESVLVSAEGDLEEGIRLAQIAMAAAQAMSMVHTSSSVALTTYVQNLFALGRVDEARLLLSSLEDQAPGHRTPILQAQIAGLHGRLGDDDIDSHFQRGVVTLVGTGHTWELAVMLETYGRSLQERGLGGSAQLTEAREIYSRLGAEPALARLDGPAEERASRA